MGGPPKGLLKVTAQLAPHRGETGGRAGPGTT